MITVLGGAALDAAVAWRRRSLERIWLRPAHVQERALLAAVRAARDTEFGRAHGFDAIRSFDDYRARVPLRDYVEFKPWLDRAAHAGARLIGPARLPCWGKTPGKTPRRQAHPLNPRALRSQRPRRSGSL